MCFFVISEPRIVPSERSILVTLTDILVFSFVSTAFFNLGSNTFSSIVLSSPKSNTFLGLNLFSFLSFANVKSSISDRSILYFDALLSLTCSKSVRPISPSTVFIPSAAIYSRSSCATNLIKFSTYSGFPLNLLRSSGFCVATPTGHVSRLHTLIITQPIVTSGAVANPYSSAPSSAATSTSRPVISFPSVSIRTCERSPFIISV